MYREVLATLRSVLTDRYTVILEERAGYAQETLAVISTGGESGSRGIEPIRKSMSVGVGLILHRDNAPLLYLWRYLHNFVYSFSGNVRVIQDLVDKCVRIFVQLSYVSCTSLIYRITVGQRQVH